MNSPGHYVANMILEKSGEITPERMKMGWEDPLEKGMATQSTILTWRIPWTEESGGLQSIGSQTVRHD